MILTQELQAETAAATAEEQSISVIDLIASGGTGSVVIIGILFVLLFVALYIYFERIFAIKAASKIDNTFMNQIRDHIVNGKIEAARLLVCPDQFAGGSIDRKRRGPHWETAG